jgi:ABC-type transporter Mla MlaB component
MKRFEALQDHHCKEDPVILRIEHIMIQPDVAVMEMHGRITMGSDSQKIEWGLAQLLKGSQKKVIFDLSDVCYVDSSGVGILMMCHAKLKKAGGVLSGHLKTGHVWSLQNRPCEMAQDVMFFLSRLLAVWQV